MPVILPKEVVEEVLGRYIQLELLKLPVKVIGSQPTEDSYMFLLQVGEGQKTLVDALQEHRQHMRPMASINPSQASQQAIQRQQQEHVPTYTTEQLPDNVQELLRAFANNSEG
jgi:hypothetical protein